ncbi:MAG: tyrosine-type recombinase/integrase [Chitinivibrionales bacterium]|nr:tyrosine-type recombinase/integrase [Chitinivibrionales bacterium]
MNRFHHFDVVAAWYADYLATRGYRPRTIAAYRFELSFFRRYLAAETTADDLEELDTTLVQGYITWLYRGDRAPATIHHKCAALVNFFGALYEENKFYRDLRTAITLPKIGKRLPTGMLSEEEMRTLFIHLERSVDLPAIRSLEEAICMRDLAMMEILYSTGMRLSELIGLRLDDIKSSDGLTHIRDGKGGWDRIVPIGEHALAATMRYIRDTRPLLVGRTPTDALLLSRRGTPTSMQCIRDSLARVLRRAGINRHITVHGIRHTCATHLLNNGADIRYAQQLLGHKCLSSTQVYTRISIAKLKDTHNTFHPREREENRNDQ